MQVGDRCPCGGEYAAQDDSDTPRCWKCGNESHLPPTLIKSTVVAVGLKGTLSVLGGLVLLAAAQAAIAAGAQGYAGFGFVAAAATFAALIGYMYRASQEE